MCMLFQCVHEDSAIPVTFSVCMCAHNIHNYSMSILYNNGGRIAIYDVA